MGKSILGLQDIQAKLLADPQFAGKTATEIVALANEPKQTGTVPLPLSPDQVQLAQVTLLGAIATGTKLAQADVDALLAPKQQPVYSSWAVDNLGDPLTIEDTAAAIVLKLDPSGEPIEVSPVVEVKP